MAQTASRLDFMSLSDDRQEHYKEVFALLHELHLSCRCEMVGPDFTVIIAPGYSSAKWWMDRFDIHD